MIAVLNEHYIQNSTIYRPYDFIMIGFCSGIQILKPVLNVLGILE